MNKIVLYIAIFISIIPLNAEENTYKYLIQNFEEIANGNSILIKSENGTNSVIYNLEYIFTNGDESIKIIRENTSSKSIGIVLKNTKVLSYTNFGKNLIILTKENNDYYTSVISITGDILQKKLIYSINIPIENDKCQIINIIDKNSYLIEIDDNLFSLKFDNEKEPTIRIISKISGNLFDLDNKSGFNKPEYAILEESNNGIIINFYDHKNNFLFLSKLVNYQKSKWVDLGTHLALLSSPVDMQTFVQIIDKNSGYLMSNFWIDTDINLINLANSGSQITATYISENGNGYNLNKMNILEDNKKVYTDKIILGEINSVPLYLTEINNRIIIIFSNSISIFDNSLELIASKFYSKGKKLFDEYSSQTIRTEQIGNTIYLISNILSIKFDLVANEYWIFKKIYFEFKNYFLIIALVLILIVFIQLYRHQRRLTKELLDLPTTGLLFVVDSIGRLTKINNTGREFLEITESAPKRKFFRFYARSPKSSALADLIEKSLETKDNYNEKVTIRIDNAETEWLCKSIALRNVTGMFRGVVLSAVDITEQLERKRLSNWAQLAHDMQTNLSTIKLNAEHLDIELSENNQNRQKKILFQVSTLMQRVRDIVTVGRNDKLNLDTCNAYELCLAVRNEFDELMFPNIEFEIESDNYSLLCDRPKLLRAVRNAVENGIKAMKGNPGKIKIKSWHERNYNVISVEDNGGGMDDEIKKKMLTPYFTTASKTGGSGIGTMIMQHVTEQHNGHIIVNSEKGIGTQVLFYLPCSVTNKGEKK
jgi:signal transduction histidine kinase